MISIFTFSYLIWLLSEIILNRLMRSKATDKQNEDRNSLLLIWITTIISIALAVYISMKYYIPVSANHIVYCIGILMILTGVILRLIIIKSLGRFFTVNVTIRQHHVLKKDGFYRYLRHPSYFASLISFAGFSLSLNNWISLFIILISVLIVFINRIKIEEKVLGEHFGSEYTEYKKITKKLIPFIY